METSIGAHFSTCEASNVAQIPSVRSVLITSATACAPWFLLARIQLASFFAELRVA